MNSKTKTTYNLGGNTFTTTYTTGAIIRGSNDGVFGSKLFNSANYPAGGTSTVRLNDKEYTINNLTGKVVKKGFSLFGVSKKTINSISNLINKAKENFENSEIIEQYSWGVSGLTGKGNKKFQKILQEAQANIKAKAMKNAEK